MFVQVTLYSDRVKTIRKSRQFQKSSRDWHMVGGKTSRLTIYVRKGKERIGDWKKFDKWIKIESYSNTLTLRSKVMVVEDYHSLTLRERFYKDTVTLNKLSVPILNELAFGKYAVFNNASSVSQKAEESMEWVANCGIEDIIDLMGQSANVPKCLLLLEKSEQRIKSNALLIGQTSTLGRSNGDR